MPKPVLSSRVLPIPEGCKVTVKSRAVVVEGPRGKLEKDFKHLSVDMFLYEDDGKQALKVEVWAGTRKVLSSVRTVCSHVSNMIIGVTQGFRYTMRFVYAHFPINANIGKNGEFIELRNFLGEKRVRKVDMLSGVKVARSDDVKDQIYLEGNDIELVGRSAALIHQVCLVKKKDIRMFLDGVYVSEKGAIQL